MKFSVSALAFVAILGMFSCRSEFERVRTSGDAEKIYEEGNKLFELGDYRKAIILYEMVIPAYRGKREAEELAYRFADAHFKSRRYILSSHYFKTFADTYTNSPKRQDALYNSAFSYYRISPKFKLEQSNTIKAIEAFQLFANTYPDSDNVETCNAIIDELRGKLEEKAYDEGRLYYNMKSYSSAIRSLENLLKDFPGGVFQEEARYLIAKASYDWAQNSIYLRQEERFHETIDRCDLYIKRHEDSERAEEIIKFKNNCLTALKQLTNG